MNLLPDGSTVWVEPDPANKVHFVPAGVFVPSGPWREVGRVLRRNNCHWHHTPELCEWHEAVYRVELLSGMFIGFHVDSQAGKLTPLSLLECLAFVAR